MSFDKEQKRILLWSALAMLFSGAVLSTGYIWIPAQIFGLNDSMAQGDQIAFALKADLLIFLWLAGCLRVVASGRFRTPSDRKGAAYGQPTPRLAIRIAILQNSLEQTVLTFGAHLNSGLGIARLRTGSYSAIGVALSYWPRSLRYQLFKRGNSPCLWHGANCRADHSGVRSRRMAHIRRTLRL